MTDSEGSAEPDDARPSSKVARLIEEYGLDESFGAYLEAQWTSDEDRMSLRSLADTFNRRLLEVAMNEAGRSVVDGEVENLYRLLTDGDVSSGVRTEAQARLERAGVDVDELQRDFVTYQAIRSYLTKYREATYESTPTDRVQKVRGTIERLQSRTQSVTTQSLQQLRDTDRITLGTFRIFVDVDVLCEECGAQYGVVELLGRGGCDCEPER
ncbi:rod-determining factor RdfA [Halomarina oriensis]|uniref:Uncharacterized protein n=1 Tax=Halomarina oriensis TaxID=671145 RepID=A0A6B0GMV2_9EURY|nr:rod-determining factor RdfA [Halomarina oriensis]MWG33455.1 hypothetical protein [Halomarina oriensis]